MKPKKILQTSLAIAALMLPASETCAGNGWWNAIGDDVLDSLETVGLRNNNDILAAISRIEAARAQVGIARSAYYPNVGVSAGWNKERTPGAMAATGGRNSTVDFFSVGATASWEIDVFGKVRASVRQRQAEWRATKAQADGVMLSISAEIATTYINYRVAQAQLAVAISHSESQNTLVKIADARHEAGLASALDPAQARTVYYSTVATIPQLESQVYSLRNALATLTGEDVSSLPAGLSSEAPLPPCPPMPVSGIPADLLRRRPDIAEAEQNLAGATAALGIARKDFLPTLSINGSIATRSHDFDNLFGHNSLAYTIAPTISWTAFSGFSRKFAVASAKAQMEALMENYNYAVRNAFAETDNAIFAYSRSIAVIKSMSKAMEQAKESYTLAVDLYKSGNSDFTNVADAMMNYLTYTNSYISAKGSAIEAMITLCKALGGTPQ